MKVMIDIPKEFEEDLKDNFQEFFNRIVADITYSLNDEEPMCCGNCERETAEMFLSAFEKATIIPDDATNGKVFTAMFPDEEVIETDSACVYFGAKMRIDRDLWNSSYKRGENK